LGGQNPSGTRPPSTIPSCSSHFEYACEDNDVYWVDSCGNAETKKQECGKSGCRNGKCNSSQTNPPNPCTPRASFSCYNNDVYSYNSCGNRETLAEACGNNKTCTNGQCKSNGGGQTAPPANPPSSGNNFGKLNMGWFCKNSSTMAYKLDDGRWVSELKCTLGCSNNKCATPLNWGKSNVSPDVGVNDTKIAKKFIFAPAVVSGLLLLAT